MHPYLLKVKHILPTFLIIALSSILGLVFIRWALSIQYDLIDLPEEVWEIGLPIAIPCLAVLIWLRPRLRVLTFKNDNGSFVLQLLAAGSLVAPMMIAQSYLSTATGKLVNIATAEKIGTVPKARYYSIQKFDVATYYGGAYTDVSTSGKYNQNLDFTTYIVYPIVTDTSLEIPQSPPIWHGVKFEKQISNKISDQEKDSQYDAFYQECLHKMDTFSFHSQAYFERVPKSNSRTGFLKAVEARTKLAADVNTVILMPITTPFDQRNGSKFAWIFISFGIGLAVVLGVLYFPTYDTESNEQIKSGKKLESDDFIDMLQYLIPRDDHFATSIILDLNLLVFLVMVFSGVSFVSPNVPELMEWGANRRSETMGGDWWRLLTSMFLHGGIIHLLCNIYGLVIAAIFLETVLGRAKYLLLYLLSGIGGSLASIWWYENTASVGASGAIFGLYGAILSLLLTNAFTKEDKKSLLVFLGIYVVVNLLWGLSGGIDNAAHIGGLLSGAVIGLLLYSFGQKNAVISKVVRHQQ